MLKSWVRPESTEGLLAPGDEIAHVGRAPHLDDARQMSLARYATDGAARAPKQGPDERLADLAPEMIGQIGETTYGGYHTFHAITSYRRNLKTGELPNLSICGKQEPIADLSARRDPSGFNEARIGRHLRFVLGIHAVNTLSRRRVSFEIDYRDVALGHTQEVNVAAEEHAIFGCSCDRVLELKLRPRFAEEAFRTQRVESAGYVGLGVVEVFDQAEALGGLPDGRGGG